MPDLTLRASTKDQPKFSIQTSTPSSPSSFPPAPPFLHAHYPATYSPHADDAFYSGAWLFEPELAPQWLIDAFPVTPVSALKERKQAKCHYQQHQQQQQRLQQQRQELQLKPKQDLTLKGTQPTKSLLTTWEETLRTGRWLFDPTSVPAWLRPHVSTPSSSSSSSLSHTKAVTSSLETMQEIRRAAHRATEDPLVTGIWLFHPEDTPVWLTRQLEGSASNSLSTSLPKKRRKHPKKQY